MEIGRWSKPSCALSKPRAACWADGLSLWHREPAPAPRKPSAAEGRGLWCDRVCIGTISPLSSPASYVTSRVVSCPVLAGARLWPAGVEDASALAARHIACAGLGVACRLSAFLHQGLVATISSRVF